MNRKVLCVDDDPNILNGYKRSLRKDFEIQIAEGGQQALSLIGAESEFAVIVSDMRMPVMDGVQFLQRVKLISPNSVRMMLTGNADQQTAVDAVNEGSIFRFLNKPCEPEVLAKALNAGLEQYALITAEKVLLNETLNKSLQVMIEILSMVNPTAFSRSNRIKRLAHDIADKLNIEKIWEIEIAAMLSQIGCITVPEDTLQKINRGGTPSEKQLNLYHQHPQVGFDLISRIPRMETVADIIANQNHSFIDLIESDNSNETAKLGSAILRVVLDFDKLLDNGSLPHQAVRDLESRQGSYSPTVLEMLKILVDEAAEEYVSVTVNVNHLKPGMLLDSPVYSTKNVLLLTEKHEVTLPLIYKLISFAESGIISPNIQVSVPVSKFQIEGEKIEEIVS